MDCYPRNERTAVIERLIERGRSAGFATFADYVTMPNEEEESFRPIIDLLWAIDMRIQIADFGAYSRFMQMLGMSEEESRFVPVAAFHIETSEPTTRGISIDLMNLMSSRARFLFELVGRKEHCAEDRASAEAIARSCQYFEGFKDIHILPIEGIRNKQEKSEPRCTIPEFSNARAWKGVCVGMANPRELCSAKRSGECARMGRECALQKTELIDSNAVRCFLNRASHLLGLMPCYFYRPTEILPPNEENIRVPKLDTVLFLPLNDRQIDGLWHLVSLSRMPARADICHFPIFGFELEGSAANKHSLGGIINLARYSYHKILLTKTANSAAKLKRAINAYADFYGLEQMHALPIAQLEAYVREVNSNSAL